MKKLASEASAAIEKYEQRMHICLLIGRNEEEDGNLGRKEKSMIWTQRGKSLVLAGGADNLKEAEEWLEKVVKMSPGETKAWNALAHLEWVRKDLQKAKQYLETSLERKDTDKDTLTMLSILYRAIPTDDVQRLENVKYSLELAHKAVSQDLGNSEAWCVLGTSHLQNFFMVDPKFEQLEMALKAY